MKATLRITLPLKWHGGKTYMADDIIGLMPEHHHVEPFCGGMAAPMPRAWSGPCSRYGSSRNGREKTVRSFVGKTPAESDQYGTSWPVAELNARGAGNSLFGSVSVWCWWDRRPAGLQPTGGTPVPPN